LIIVPKESSQVEKTITYTNLAAMYARLAPGCFKNAVWMCNQTAIPQLLSVYVPIGESYGAAIPSPVLKESNGTFSIFGIPVVFTEHCPALGSQGDIVLVDWSQYAVGIRKEISIDKSQHVGFMEDTSMYRVIVRVDGMSTWKDVITPLNGDTQSWCVTLAERS
ncbi:MAG: phage major capsid protein, partial [Proteobacteria bacterium]|nr:phage major capsid protein [Pseudomonadota bacterium]